MEIKFDKDPLVVQKNNYLSEIVKVYMVYDLDTWSRHHTNNFKFKNCLFGADSIVKNSDKENFVYGGYGITFDSTDSWNFDNETARNVIVFLVDNSSSTHSNNRNNEFLVLDEGPAFGINGNFSSPAKNFSINFTKTQNFA